MTPSAQVPLTLRTAQPSHGVVRGRCELDPADLRRMCTPNVLYSSLLLWLQNFSVGIVDTNVVASSQPYAAHTSDAMPCPGFWRDCKNPQVDAVKKLSRSCQETCQEAASLGSAVCEM